MISDKSRRAASWSLFVGGLIGVGWGFASWLQPLSWDRGLWILSLGLVVWCGALGAAGVTPRAFVALAGLAGRAGRAVGIDLSTPRRRFAAVGALTWAVAAGMLAQQYLYLFKYWGAQLGFLVATGVAGWVIHAGVDAGMAVFSGRIFPGDDWRRAAGSWAIYLLEWAGALYWLFPHWEALGTDPVGGQFILAAVLGLALVWLLAGRVRGPEGRTHRVAIIVAAVAAVAVGGYNWNAESSRAVSPRLRVLLLTLDTTRADYLSCYGYPRETSPNLDALAAGGVRCARAFSMAGLTDPSHASILTGTYPRTHGLVSQLNGVTGKVPSIAEYFYERGFATAAVGSRDHVTPSGLNVPGYAEMSGVSRWMGQTFAPEAYRRAANYLYRHRDQDLFLWVHFFDPHESYRPHPGFSEKFYGQDRGERSSKLHRKGHKEYPPDEVKYRRDLYAGEIFYMDYYIGKLLRLMETMTPVPDQPLLVAVTADHGEFLGEYQRHPEALGFGHGPVYNLGVHVPLIFSWPGKIPAGTVVDEVVQGIDLAPTLVGYGLGVPYPSQGQDLKPVFEGRPGRNFALITHCRNHAVPTERWDAMYALVADDWKYMVSYQRDGELFDLSEDWAEAFDLSAALPGKAADLLSAWEKWMKDTPESVPENRKLDQSEKRALKALGYVDN